MPETLAIFTETQRTNEKSSNVFPDRSASDVSVAEQVVDVIKWGFS
jgi:hypothetical protein